MESGPHQTHCLNVLVRQELIFSLDVGKTRVNFFPGCRNIKNDSWEVIKNGNMCYKITEKLRALSLVDRCV